MTHFGRAAQLATLAITGQTVAYLVAVLLARRLGVDGFEAYVVASALFILMVPDDVLEESVLDASPIEVVDELLQVAVEVLLAHAMVRTAQPSLEVREDRMRPRQQLDGTLGAPLGLRLVMEAPSVPST